MLTPPPDPAQCLLFADIRDNLHARIAAAIRERWHGEVKRFKVGLNGATSKITG